MFSDSYATIRKVRHGDTTAIARIANPSTVKTLRGFKSLTLRHLIFTTSNFGFANSLASGADEYYACLWPKVDFYSPSSCDHLVA